jgi:hypothetical protein
MFEVSIFNISDVECMGVNHGGGGRIPPEFAVGTLIQVVPPDFCRFSKFQALAMDSSPPPDFNPDLRHWLNGMTKEKRNLLIHLFKSVISFSEVDLIRITQLYRFLARL